MNRVGSPSIEEYMIRCEDCGRHVPIMNLQIHQAHACTASVSNNSVIDISSGSESADALVAAVTNSVDDDNGDDLNWEDQQYFGMNDYASQPMLDVSMAPSPVRTNAYVSPNDDSDDGERKVAARESNVIDLAEDGIIDLYDFSSDNEDTNDDGKMSASAVVVDETETSATDHWSCPQCTLDNDSWKSTCDACAWERSGSGVVREPDAVRTERLVDDDDLDASPLWSSTLPRRAGFETQPSAAASSPLGYVSGGALLGGVLGATGAYMGGRPLASSTMQGAVSGALSGAIYEQFFASTSPMEQLLQATLMEDVATSRNTVPRSGTNGRTFLDHETSSTTRTASLPPSESRSARPRNHRTATSYVRNRRRRSTNDDDVDPFFDHMFQILSTMEASSERSRPYPFHVQRFSGHRQPNIDQMSYDQLLSAFGDGSDNLGGSEADIQNLPVVALTDPTTELPPDCRQCHICLEDFAGGDQRKTLPCLHGFHVSCADTWLRSNGSCPVCKHKISSPD